MPILAVEIVRSGTGRKENQSAIHIQSHVRPGIRSGPVHDAFVVPPCFEARLTSHWNVMKSPHKLSGADVVGVRVAAAARIGFSGLGTENDHTLVNNSRV